MNWTIETYSYEPTIEDVCCLCKKEIQGCSITMPYCIEDIKTYLFLCDSCDGTFRKIDKRKTAVLPDKIIIDVNLIPLL